MTHAAIRSPRTVGSTSRLGTEEKQSLRRSVIRYYEQNQFFYDRFWADRSTYSMNYGYWSPSARRLRDAFRNQNQAISDALRVESSDRVLEAGCGTGGATVWISRRHGSRGVGITLCGGQAARGRRIALEKGVAERVKFLVMDYTEMGLPSESFTKVFASESVCYALDKADFVREAYRVLKPGGRLVVLDGFRCGRRLDPSEEAVLARWAKGWAVPDLASTDAFEAHLHGAGFRGIEFGDQTARIMPSARRIYARGLAAWAPAKAAHAAGWITPVQLAHVRSSLDQYSVWRDRIALHGLFTAQKR